MFGKSGAWPLPACSPGCVLGCEGCLNSVLTEAGGAGRCCLGRLGSTVPRRAGQRRGEVPRSKARWGPEEGAGGARGPPSMDAEAHGLFGAVSTLRGGGEKRAWVRSLPPVLVGSPQKLSENQGPVGLGADECFQKEVQIKVGGPGTGQK